MQNIPAILSEIGIDENELSTRRAFLSFDECDAVALKELHGILEIHRGNLADKFYSHLLHFPEIRPLLGDEAKLSYLKRAQEVYFSQLTSGCYDLSYVANRLRIGLVHQRVGLTPKWYMSAYCNYLREVFPLILEHYADNPARGQSACAALLKIVFFDMGLALDTYFYQVITQRKQSEEEIHRLAFYDSLTQLPNRRLLHERLMQSMSISARSSKHGALMFIDLDNFKTLNDTQGHDVGDLLLKEVAHRLLRNVREGDTVARLGGDEFVVALESLSSITHEAASQSEMIAEKVRAELSLPYLLNGFEHNCSPSIGVSLFRGHQSSLEEILKQADLAMYQAKASGRNRVCFFDPAMQAEMEYRAELEKDLRVSIRLHQFQLYYQMQVDETGCIVAAEALIRWFHPQRGLVPPAQFIPLAEEIGMILPIGDWVIEQACTQLKLWEMDPLMRKLRLSVNVSPRQLSQPYFVEQVKEAIEKTGIRASKLKLELTESFILHDLEEAIEKMLELRRIGIRFAMDDFGTGYSSLAYLTRLPLEQLKIDQSFVRDIPGNKNSNIMVRTIINIANNMGMEVVAEGVETDDQFAFLLQYGCSKFQGYLFGKPVPLEEFERLCLQGLR